MTNRSPIRPRFPRTTSRRWRGEHVTVALSGDGGDENFAGYRRYKLTMWEDRLRSYVPAPVRRTVFGPLGQIYPKLGWAPRVFRFKSTFQSLSRDLPIDGYYYGISSCPPAMKSRLLSSDVVRPTERLRLG